MPNPIDKNGAPPSPPTSHEGVRKVPSYPTPNPEDVQRLIDVFLHGPEGSTLDIPIPPERQPVFIAIPRTLTPVLIGKSHLPLADDSVQEPHVMMTANIAGEIQMSAYTSDQLTLVMRRPPQGTPKLLMLSLPGTSTETRMRASVKLEKFDFLAFGNRWYFFDTAVVNNVSGIRLRAITTNSLNTVKDYLKEIVETRTVTLPETKDIHAIGRNPKPKGITLPFAPIEVHGRHGVVLIGDRGEPYIQAYMGEDFFLRRNKDLYRIPQDQPIPLEDGDMLLFTRELYVYHAATRRLMYGGHFPMTSEQRNAVLPAADLKALLKGEAAQDSAAAVKASVSPLAPQIIGRQMEIVMRNGSRIQIPVQDLTLIGILVPGDISVSPIQMEHVFMMREVLSTASSSPVLANRVFIQADPAHRHAWTLADVDDPRLKKWLGDHLGEIHKKYRANQMTAQEAVRKVWQEVLSGTRYDTGQESKSIKGPIVFNMASRILDGICNAPAVLLQLAFHYLSFQSRLERGVVEGQPRVWVRTLVPDEKGNKNQMIFDPLSLQPIHAHETIFSEYSAENLPHSPLLPQPREIPTTPGGFLDAVKRTQSTGTLTMERRPLPSLVPKASTNFKPWAGMAPFQPGRFFETKASTIASQGNPSVEGWKMNPRVMQQLKRIADPRERKRIEHLLRTGKLKPQRIEAALRPDLARSGLGSFLSTGAPLGSARFMARIGR